MDFHIKTIVFNNTPEIYSRVSGEDYINYFLNYSFPSLLSPNNIPIARDLANIEWHIYTHTQDEVDRITKAIGYYNQYFPIKLQTAPVDESYYADSENTAQGAFFKYFTTDNPGNVPILFSNANYVWSDGSLNYIIKSLRDNKVVFPPLLRVASETILPELDFIKHKNVLSLPPLAAQQLAIKHLIPYQGAMHHRSHHYHPWAEYLIVPVGTEGLLIYHAARAFQAFVPNSFAVTGSLYIAEDYNNIKSDIVRYGSLCLGLEVQWMMHEQRLETLRKGFPFNTATIGSFLKDPRYSASSAFNIEAFKVPTRIFIVDNPNYSLWNEVEKRIDENIIKPIIDYNGPSIGYAVSSMSDKQLQIESLEWLEPVINGKFPQASLEYLRSH
jgi:hypothetical protein